MKLTEINSLDEIRSKIENSPAVLIYFSHDQCNVCKILKPKIAEMLTDSFPKMEMIYVNTQKSPESAGQNNIFTVPTIVAFFDGKEAFRKSRNFGTEELKQAISGTYHMIFE
jgi:thioredoxin-like negative regulator of GroEL